MPSAERYFVVGALSDYTDYPELDEEAVTGEVRSMREALTQLGYTEIERPEDDRRGPRELMQVLRRWITQLDKDPGARRNKPGLLVYFTGHGIASGQTLYLPEADAEHDPTTLVDSDSHVEAFRLADRARKTDVLDDYLLILDTCHAGQGALDIVAKEATSAGGGRERPNLWVISAARTFETAKVSRFATAFRTSLGMTEGHHAQVDVTEFVGLLNTNLGTGGQQAELIVFTHSACGLLLDPQYMPTELPAELPSWTSFARGVAFPRTPGWYFGGRDAALTAVNEHLAGDEPGPLAIAGGPGSGRTSLLRWAQLGATPELWAMVPPIARPRAVHVTFTGTVEYLALGDQAPDAVLAEVAELLGVPSAEIAALTADPPRAALLVDLAPGAPHHPDTLAYVSALSQVAGLRVVVAGSHSAVEPLTGRTIDLDTADPATSVELGNYLAFRLRKAPRTAGLDELVERCCNNFYAAARAAEELVATGDDDKAIGTAATVLTNRAIQDVQPSRTRAWAIAMLRPFVFGRPLSDAQWATLAAALSGGSYGADDVAIAADRLGRYLTHDAPAGTWALRFTPTASDFELDAGSVHDALVDLVPEADGVRQWDRAETVYLDVLVDHPTGSRGASLLDDPVFLLAAPSATVDAALRDDTVLSRIWRRTRHAGVPWPVRAASLALHSYAAGRVDFARRLAGDDLPFAVDWRQPEGATEPARLAVDGSDSRFAVTAGVDGSLTVWALDTGKAVRELPAEDRGAVAALGMSIVDDEPLVVAAYWSGSLVMWDPARNEAAVPVAEVDGVMGVAVDASYRVAVVDGTRLRVLDGRGGGEVTEPAPIPEAAAVRITERMIAVATMAGELHVRAGDRTSVSVHEGRLGGLTPTLGLSEDGSGAVWAARDQIWAELPGAPRRALGVLRDVTQVALSDRWVAAVSMQDTDIVRVWEWRTGQSWDIPLDDLCVGVALAAQNVLVVAMQSGLARFRLGPAVTRTRGDATL